MKDELGRPMTLLVKAAIPKNCKTEASESFPNKKEIRRPLLVDRCDQNDHIDSEKRTCERIAVEHGVGSATVRRAEKYISEGTSTMQTWSRISARNRAGNALW